LLSLLLLASCVRLASAEWALINLIRHGERSANKSNVHLTHSGYARSQYIAQCVGDTPSLAFPLGKPTAMIASLRPEDSERPLETLKPLSEKIGLSVDNHIEMADVDKVHEYVQSLPAGGTLLLSWQHWFIPLIARSFETGAKGLAPQLWPSSCDYSEWTEPTYTNDACYDAIWQIVLYRDDSGHPWRAQAFAQMHMGFGGLADSPCASALYPYSNPTNWAKAISLPTAIGLAQNTLLAEERSSSPVGSGAAQRDAEIRSASMSGASTSPLVAVVLTACLVAAATSVLVASAYEGPASLVAKAKALVGLRADASDTYLPPQTLGAPLLHEGAEPLSARTTRTGAVAAVGALAVGAVCAVGVVGAYYSAPTATSATVVLAAAAADKNFWFDFFAGGFAGALAKTISAPIERVKLLIQTQDKIPQIVSGEMPRYKGIIDCFVRVANEQGFSSFWRGNLPNVLRYFPVAAFNFAFNDAIKGWFPSYSPKTDFALFLAVNLLSGGLAGAGSLTIVYPLDYARTRLAADVGGDKNSPMMRRAKDANQPASGREFSGLVDCITKTVAKNGFFALYQGYAVSVVGIIAYRAPYFGLFDTFDALNPLKPHQGSSWGAYLLGVFASFCIAQFTSAIAALISYPFDTVRRRLQMEGNVAKEDRLYRGMCQCAYVIIQKEGFDALYKGFLANLLRGASTAFMLVLFNQLTGISGSE